MQRYEAIRLAEEVGLTIRGYYDETGSTPDELQRFASAVEQRVQQNQSSARMREVLELLVSVKFGHQGWTDTVYRAACLAQDILGEQQ